MFADLSVGFSCLHCGSPEPRGKQRACGFFATMEEIHIGRMIRQKLKEQGRTVTWFASAIHCDRSSAYRIFSSKTIDLFLLIRISKLLDYNFLYDCSKKI